VKGQPQGISGRFYKARIGERGLRPGAMAEGAPAASKHSRGKLEWRGNGRN
jgi:hypothetical protein